MNTALLLSTAGTRSPAAIPPVRFSSTQAVDATFDTKLFEASLVIEYTVMDDPDASDCAGTTVPDPFAAVSTLTVVAVPGMTEIVPDGVVASTPEVALISAVPIT